MQFEFDEDQDDILALHQREDEDFDFDEEDEDDFDEEEDDNSSTTSSLEGKLLELNVDKEKPAWACRYCGVSSPNCVTKCLESNKYFCNGSGGSTASHIVQHMVRAHNREICLHPDSVLGETIVECFNCASRNAFNMGFLPKGDGVVILLCRNCLGIGALKELGWDHEAWMPVVKDRALVPWLVAVPDSSEPAFSLPSASQIERLETLWKSEPNATMEDLDKRVGFEEEPQHVLLRYEDGFHFQNVFGPLVQIEADYDRDAKESLAEDNVSMTWHPSKTGGDKWTTADVMFTPSASESLRLTMGDELLLRLSQRLRSSGKSDWEAKATVVRVGEPGETTLVEVRTSTRPPLDVREGYTVSFMWKPISFDRMQLAMKKFAMDTSAVSNVLYRKILGITPMMADEAVSNMGTEAATTGAPGLPDLNPSQQSAVQQVLTRSLALIQGPPGTGKTVTLATLVYQMVAKERRKKRGDFSPVLVCAPSNVAVDHLAERINQTGVRVVRLSAKSREHIESKVEHLTLHHMIDALEKAGASKTKQGSRRSGQGGDKGSSRSRKLERELLASADVVCCTCSGAGDPRLEGIRFRRVLVDEATQATEPESLIPIVMGCEQFILVGDHCQLGPVVMSKRAANAGLNASLFERLVILGLRPVRLQVQYRMHPCLSEWVSNTFYEGSLQNGVTAEDRTNTAQDFPWIDTSRPMMFYSCQGSEEMAATGTSYLNRAEATNVEKIVTALIRGGVAGCQIGVITPYEGQRAFIVTQLANFGSLHSLAYAEVEVSSVDAFQGREKEYIVVSCVRSNEKLGIGFLSDPRRLNVALTRAKRGLVVLGNPRVLAKKPLWNDLLVHFRERHLLVEGPLSNLQPSLMKFPMARKYYRDPKQRALDQASKQVFSGDVANPYGEIMSAPANSSTGYVFGDYDYGVTTQQSQTLFAGGWYYQDRQEDAPAQSTPSLLSLPYDNGPITQSTSQFSQS
ncbi:hypothetical protein BASA81_011125 [Batrachochytrium salamandrivorans]|nr:hypothetical protein BASA81_011125 [Batrachochytrium salamandrivorans]